MITKVLKRFCSQEVRLLVTHLEEHPEDFTGYDSYWEKLADNTHKMTPIEAIVVTRTKKTMFKKLARQKFLGEIVSQTISPRKLNDVEDEERMQIAKKYSMNLAQGMGSTAAAIQQVQLSNLYQQQMAMNAAQGITYDGSQRGLGNTYSTTTTTSQP